MKLRTLTFALSLALLGCNSPAPSAPAPTAASASAVTATGYLHPTAQDGRLLDVMSPWTSADIDHAVLTLRQGDATIATLTIPHASLGQKVIFSALHQSTDYTVLAQAYRDASGTIEIDNAAVDARSCTTPFSTTLDPTVSIGDIALKLTNKTYSGTTQGTRLAITDGQVVDTEESTSISLVPWSFGVLAGFGESGFADGAGVDAAFAHPDAVAIDTSGTAYVADEFNNAIRKVTAAGTVSTLIGSPEDTALVHPCGVALDSSGNVYVADAGGEKIHKITPAGEMTTLAGSGEEGAENGNGGAASFDDPQGVAVDANGNVYVAEVNNDDIRKITPDGVVTTLAGSTTPGSADGTGSAASFCNPEAVAVDASGNVYVADTGNHEIRKITPDGVVTTLAGSTTAGSADGTGAEAAFGSPTGVAVDAADNVYVADLGARTLREVTHAGVVSTLVTMSGPRGVGLDAHGDVYVVDAKRDQLLRQQ
ncbi:MAG TPA: NHL repeat-containing protein [Oscillatoriaceae cyanobacterium]